MDKRKVAKVLEEVGTLLQLHGANQFRTRAYFNAARVVETMKDDLSELVNSGAIKEVKGIGDALAAAISELVQTGKLSSHQELLDKTPPGLLDMLKVPGLGPKKIYTLHNDLGVTSIAELEYACIENRLISLKGFGPKSQENIIKGIEQVKKHQGKYLFADALFVAQEIIAQMKTCSHVKSISLAGSLRRYKEVVKDVDIVTAGSNAEAIKDHFANLPQVAEITSSGNTKVSAITTMGINVDLRIVEPIQFPYVLHHFTGSKDHNTALRQLAKKRGIKINEYGLFQGESNIVVKDEKEFFSVLGLDYIPPELRENMGEISAAEQDKLPQLITGKDIKGVLHLHTTYSDGSHSLKAMAEAAQKLGYSYIGITDHSQSAVYARGLSLDDIKRQREEIDQLNSDNEDFYIFQGIESDIHKDGSLDYPDQVLASFDFVIASVHSAFSITGTDATKRLITAMENPYTTMLGHPTGRLLLGRQGYEPELEYIIEAAIDNNVILELNASPHRLDLSWSSLKLAKDAGATLVINPDAHKIEELHSTDYGIYIGRKGWLEPRDVFNTRSLPEVKDSFSKSK
ncbi:DNA polymerase (family 10) [Desulfitispora alkaliphila]|uniref:DNA polymerase/3'-5' exonuclease PolX n=1 Tax=Desulfitispora alkaliphila TaxID=622674 RepID=UPI003D1E1BB4